jgi:hypothetical protein
MMPFTGTSNQKESPMKSEESTTKDCTNARTFENERPRHSILRAIAQFALSCATAPLTKYMSTRRSAADDELETVEPTNAMRMAVASFKHQVECLCTSCECELIVTAFREEFLKPKWRFSNESSNAIGLYYAICEPFTPTEIDLLDTNDGDYIRRSYPTLAPRIQTEIETRYLNDLRRHRGVFCTSATRH